MKVNPEVFIVIVNYNGYKDTIECIRSLKNIEYKNFEIVVVDNNSFDGSVLKIKEKFNDINIIESKINLGFSGANNLGIKYAMDNKADYVLLLNNDTEVDKYFLSNIIERVKDEKNIGISTGKIKYYDDKNVIWYAGGKFNKYKGNSYHIGINEVDNNQYDYEKKVTFISGCYMLIPIHIFEEVGLLSEEYFLYHEDTDYCCKVMKAGYDLFYYGNSYIYHKVSASTGKNSDLYTYYYTRNRCILINNNLEVPFKQIAFLFYFSTRILKIIFKSKERNTILQGLKDYRNGVVGYKKI